MKNHTFEGLEFSAKAQHELRSSGILSVGHLAMLTRSELQGLGLKAIVINEAVERLLKHGVNLRQRDPVGFE